MRFEFQTLSSFEFNRPAIWFVLERGGERERGRGRGKQSDRERGRGRVTERKGERESDT